MVAREGNDSLPAVRQGTSGEQRGQLEHRCSKTTPSGPDTLLSVGVTGAPREQPLLARSRPSSVGRGHGQTAQLLPDPSGVSPLCLPGSPDTSTGSSMWGHPCSGTWGATLGTSGPLAVSLPHTHPGTQSSSPPQLTIAPPPFSPRLKPLELAHVDERMTKGQTGKGEKTSYMPTTVRASEEGRSDEGGAPREGQAGPQGGAGDLWQSWEPHGFPGDSAGRTLLGEARGWGCPVCGGGGQDPDTQSCSRTLHTTFQA